jgi:hypothetical protein
MSLRAAVNDLPTEERAENASLGTLEAHLRAGSNARQPSPSITARPCFEEKARFTLLARQLGLSESALALNAIRALLDRDEQWLDRQPALKWEQVAASDRITIRLRPGDGLEVIRRATKRDMKAATYISALVRAHITANPPLAAAEVNALKTAILVLANLGAMLAKAGRDGIPSGLQGEVYGGMIRRTRREIAVLERRFVDFTKAALIAWETRS